MSLLAGVALATGCAAPPPPPVPRVVTPPYQAAETWSEPIADYLAIGREKFPDGFTTSITALETFDPDGPGREPARLWIAYGDATRNMGTQTPIEFRYFEDASDPQPKSAVVLAGPPDLDMPQGAPQRTQTDTGEEQIEPYRVIDGMLWQAGVDSNDPDELWTQAKPAPQRLIEGNVFMLLAQPGDPTWRKFRSIPGGEHVHDICGHDGAIWAVGSGSADRGEWESGEIFRYLWKSTDGGVTFEPALRVMFPDAGKGDTRFRRLLPSGDALFVFGYVNPFVDGGPVEGRHVMLREESFTELTADEAGDLAGMMVMRTWPLDGDTGLVLARNPDRSTRMFLVESGAIEPLDSWSEYSVVDIAPGAEPGEFVMVANHAADPDRASVLSFSLAGLRAGRTPVEMLELFEAAPTAIAWWNGDLFIGTDDGRVLRAAAAAPWSPAGRPVPGPSIKVER